MRWVAKNVDNFNVIQFNGGNTRTYQHIPSNYIISYNIIPNNRLMFNGYRLTGVDLRVCIDVSNTYLTVVSTDGKHISRSRLTGRHIFRQKIYVRTVKAIAFVSIADIVGLSR